MISLLAFRSLLYRPYRSVLLFLGYGMGVAVMIVLLSIGEALLDQASVERLVGGGDITVLPQGLDIEVMKTGGVGGLYFSIDNSRFVYRQILAAPRLSTSVRAVSPQIEGKLVYLRTSHGREIPVRATGEIPSATRAVGAGAGIASGSWSDDAGDVEYIAPTDYQLRNEMDHFHVPAATVAHRDTWAEWHYFNVVAPDGKSWVFISYIVAGDVRGSRWGGELGVTVHDANGAIRRYSALAPAAAVKFSTTSANLTIGAASVTVMQDGRYHITGTAASRSGGAPLSIDLIVTPAARAYFPGASLGESDFISGYVVPALRASATGTVCEASSCSRYDGAQSYHDHNWGVWKGVTWDWGASRAGSYTLLYGRVIVPDSVGSTPPLLVYLTDSLGFRAVFRPREISYTDARTITVGGATVHVPSSAYFADVRGGDTLRVALDIESAMVTDQRTSVASRGDAGATALTHPYFIQMKGVARISGRVGGAPVTGSGTGFFETYR